MKSSLLNVQRALGALVVLALLVTIIPAVTAAAPPAQSPVVYYVRYGDTLFSIAQRFGTTVPALMAANGLTSYYIYAGQRLVIPPMPVPSPVPPYTCKYTVQYRDTIYSIAYRYKVPWYALMQANYLYSPYVYVGMQLNVPCLTPAPTPFPTHTVQATDNLFRLAIKYETSVYAIALVNGIVNPNLIYIGQTLVIPYPGTVKWPPVPTITPTLFPFTPGLLTPTPTRTPTATATQSGGTPRVVIMQGALFLPNTITINRGETVQWKNQDAINHTVTSGVPGSITSLFRSGPIAPNETFQFTFQNAGVYPYFSELDQNMTGSVTVQ